MNIIAGITSATGMSSVFRSETYGSQILGINLETRDNVVVYKTEGFESTFTEWFFDVIVVAVFLSYFIIIFLSHGQLLVN